MTFTDTIIVLFVLFALFVIIYSKIKNKDLKETLDEVKEIVNPTEITYGR